MFRTQQGFASKSTLITIVVMIALLAFVVSKLPRGYSDDISKIGKGTNVVALIHDKNNAYSLNTMALLNEVRNEYSEKIKFLVVDLATPQGKAFSQQQEIFTSALALFSSDGERLVVLTDIEDSNMLRAALEQAFK
ncbi:MAG: hypothetical protein KAJ19_08200 [Gammaproteobacteria bacterium]|nr:hypothetical protein [Gammaproteobacteria bacterium]